MRWLKEILDATADLLVDLLIFVWFFVAFAAVIYLLVTVLEGK